MNTVDSNTPAESENDLFLCDQGRTHMIPIEVDDKIDGICKLNDSLWLSRSKMLYRIDCESGKVRSSHKLRISKVISHLCTDGELIYAIESGYGEGRSIYIFDPEEEIVLDKVTTNINGNKRLHSAYGIDFGMNSLYVLARAVGSPERSVFKINPSNGRIMQRIDLDLSSLDDASIVGLASVGEYFVSLEVAFDGFNGSTLLHYFNREDGGHEGCIPLSKPISTLSVDKDRFYLPGNALLNDINLIKGMQFRKEQNYIYELTLGEGAFE